MLTSRRHKRNIPIWREVQDNCGPPRPHSDDLYRFSYGVFKIEYVIIKLVFFGLFLFGLYNLIAHETGFSLGESRPTGISESAPSDSSASPQATFPEPRPISSGKLPALFYDNIKAWKMEVLPVKHSSL